MLAVATNTSEPELRVKRGGEQNSKTIVTRVPFDHFFDFARRATLAKKVHSAFGGREHVTPSTIGLLTAVLLGILLFRNMAQRTTAADTISLHQYRYCVIVDLQFAARIGYCCFIACGDLYFLGE